jgi:hypothetical protein
VVEGAAIIITAGPPVCHAGSNSPLAARSQHLRTDHAGRGRQQRFEVLDGDHLIFVNSTGSGRVVVGWTRPEQTTNLAHHCTRHLATAAK